MKALYASQAELGRTNETLASQALETQQSLYALRQETQEAFDEAKTLEARWASLEKEQRDVYSRFNAQFLLMRLRHATTAQDDASEALAAEFIRQDPSRPGSTGGDRGSGTPTPVGRDVENFVHEFRELRKTYHKRVIWGDKWTHGQVEWRDD